MWTSCVKWYGLWNTWSENPPRYIPGFFDLDRAERAAERRARDLEPLSPISLTACRCREEHWSQQCVKFVIEICSVCDKVVCKVIPLCIKVPNGLLGFFVVCFPLETLQCLNILFLF